MRLKIRNNICFMSVIVALLLCVSFNFRYFKADAQTYGTSAASAIVVERTGGKVLYSKNADEKRPIASTTKILTALTVLRICKDLEETVTVPDEAVGVEGSSIYLARGEKLRIIDMLYGLMLQSGNDCAVALAVTTAGSVEKFARLMNDTARASGASNSNFINPHGLPDSDHYSTAADMALIACAAMRHDVFREIVATKVYKDCTWKDHEYNRTINNKNKILSMLEGGNGIKTGYTKAAGRCLVSSAQRNGKEVICVVLDCGPMFEDSCKLINAAFEELEKDAAAKE